MGPGVAQRQVDCETGSRDSCVCPTCGESFQTGTMLKLHCAYNAHSDMASGIAPEEAHHELTDEEVKLFAHVDPTRDDIRSQLASGYLELVVLVEGIEPTTSSTLQSRHSYLLGGDSVSRVDVEWDKQFVDCCMLPKGGNS